MSPPSMYDEKQPFPSTAGTVHRGCGEEQCIRHRSADETFVTAVTLRETVLEDRPPSLTPHSGWVRVQGEQRPAEEELAHADAGQARLRIVRAPEHCVRLRVERCLNDEDDRPEHT